MKQTVEKQKPNGLLDYIALALTTFGVGYIPGAPGTYGSAVGLVVYLIVSSYHLRFVSGITSHDRLWWFYQQMVPTAWLILLTIFSLIGFWASSRTIPLLGNEDPSEAVVDEVIGQLVAFCFVPFGLSWPFVLAGFLLFRFFDIWKPYPIRDLEILPGGLGICADDIVAGVYAGICLAATYAVYLSL